MSTFSGLKTIEFDDGEVARGTDVLYNDQLLATFLNNANLDSTNINMAFAASWTGVHTFLSTKLKLRSSGAAFDVIFASTEALTGSRTLTLSMGDANRAISLAGDISLAGALATSGAYSVTFTLTGATNVTFPTSGTLITSAAVAAAYQPLDSDLTSIAGLATSGLMARIAAGNTVTRTLQSSGAGISVGDGDGVLANPTVFLSGEALALAGMASNGIVARTGSATYAQRTLTAPAAGITVSNGNGVSGNPTLALANDLSALEAMSGTGIVARTGSETYSQVTITSTTGISVGNGDGILGAPTISPANDLAALEAMSGTGLVARTGSETYSQRTITGPAAGITVTNGSGVSGNPTLALANDLSAIEALATTNAFPVRTGTDTWTTQPYLEGTFTPTVTLVGGAGNTVPVYVNNIGRYVRIGRRVFVDVDLSGDGGAEGAGTGTFTIALPIAVSASAPSSFLTMGHGTNGITEYILMGSLGALATTMSIGYWSSISAYASFTGATQNSTTREVQLSFSYEI